METTDLSNDSETGFESLPQSLSGGHQRPEGSDALLLLEVVGRDVLQRLQDSFATATGVASVVVDLDNRLITRPSNFTRVCELISQTEEGRRRCEASNRARSLRARALDLPTYQQCQSCGFVDASVPVFIGGRQVAEWLIGQVNALGVDRRSVEAYAAEVGADVAAVSAAFDQVPTITVPEFERVLDLLYHVANDVSALGYANLQLTRRAAERQLAEDALHRSEQQLRAILDYSPALISTCNRDGVFTRVNRRFEVLAGPPSDGFIGKSVFDVFSQQAAAQVWKNDLAALEADSAVEAEEIFEHRDGTLHTYLCVKFPLKDAEGQVHSICSISTDITDREKALKDLHLTRFAVDHCADAALWMRPDGRFVYVNEAACKSLGYTEEELLALSVFDINPDLPRDAWVSHWELTRREGASTLEAHHRTKEGRVFPVEVSCNPVVFAGQEYNCAFARDISERKMHEGQAARAQKLESIGVLAGGIAHDFNNLLTGVLGNISLARAETDPEVISLILDRAERAATRAAALTKRLLTFSKGGDPILEPSDISRVVREAATFAATGTTVRLEFVISNELYGVEIDEGQIGQAVHNLVLNAIQAISDPGMITVALTNANIRRQPGVDTGDGRYVKLVVKDTGRGIPPDQIERVFDPYYTTQKSVGHGLGLAVVHSIVRKHGGFVEVESTIGYGSTFAIYLPASAGGSEVVVPDVPSLNTPSCACDISLNARVLVLDDEGFMRDLAAKVLMKAGCEVDCVDDGTEAIALYRRALESGRPYQVAVLDLTIPGGLGGKDTVQVLREMDPNVKAIVCSGYSHDPVMASPTAYGFAGVVAKPFKAHELVAVVRKVAGRPV